MSNKVSAMGMSEELAYQLYKVAFENYERAIGDLTQSEHDEALRIAKRKIKIEALVLNSVEASGVRISDSQIEQAMAEISDRYNEHGAMESELEVLGMSREGLADAVARELRVNAVLDYVAGDNLSVSETDASLYYYMNVEKFKQPEIRTARHILITVNEASVENTREVSLKKMYSIASRLRKKPERFEEQAMKHSECPTSLKGGLLGQVKAGILYPELESVLFDLQVGETSDVVESPLGFHILRCDEIQDAGLVPLQAILPRLRESLETQKRKKAQRKWLDDLLKRSAAPMGEAAHV